MTTKDKALRMALEALEVATTPLAKDRQEVLRARAAIREALAEQPAQQEFICSTGLCHYKAQQQEPVATVIQFDGEKIIDASMEFFDKYPIGTELYTSPPASKPWVGLTEEQKAELVFELFNDGKAASKAMYLLTAHEAKLREKNT